jgi:F-type H+-transporting ATPase subunit beta
MPATGKITQVIGSTFDVEFPEHQLPGIYNAINVDYTSHGATTHLVGEVQQHLGGGKVRAVALGSTDGLSRGMDVVDTGASLTVPVGKETLGRFSATPSITADPVRPPSADRFTANRRNSSI